MKHLIVGMLLGVLVGLALMGFGSPPTAAGRGQRTFTPIVITLVPGAPTTLRTRTRRRTASPSHRAATTTKHFRSSGHLSRTG